MVNDVDTYLQIEKTNDEQKTKIRNTERALKVAEVIFRCLLKLILFQMVVDGAYQQSIFHVCLQEEMLKAKFEATSKAKALTEVLIDNY